MLKMWSQSCLRVLCQGLDTCCEHSHVKLCAYAALQSAGPQGKIRKATIIYALEYLDTFGRSWLNALHLLAHFRPRAARNGRISNEGSFQGQEKGSPSHS